MRRWIALDFPSPTDASAAGAESARARGCCCPQAYRSCTHRSSYRRPWRALRMKTRGVVSKEKKGRSKKRTDAGRDSRQKT